MAGPMFDVDKAYWSMMKWGAILGGILGLFMGFMAAGIGGAIVFAALGTIAGAIGGLALWFFSVFLLESIPLIGLILVVVAVVFVIYILWGVGKPH